MFTSIRKEDFDKSETEYQKNSFEIDEDELITKYQLNECVDWIILNKFEKTCLQFPEHLLCDSTLISLYLQKVLNKVVYVLADTCYGSCCVDEVAGAHVNSDSIIHFGHACLSPVVKLPVFFVFEKKNLNIPSFVNNLEDFKNFSLIVFYDDVFHHLYSEFSNVVRGRKNIYISRLKVNQDNLEIKKNERIISGRILSAHSDAYTHAVYIGTESVTFTNLVMALPEFLWYQYTEDGGLVQYNINRNKFFMQKNFLIEKVKSANVLGILIGTLGIKNYLEAVERVKVLAKSKGKKCYKLVVGKPNEAKLANFPEIDVFVYLACQENSLLHNFKGFYKPVVSLYEVEMALGKLSYSQAYSLDFREFLEGGSFYYHHPVENNMESTGSPTEFEPSQALLERNPGTIIESSGSEFLMSRSWRGLEQNLGKTEVHKATKGRTGVAQSYDNELETLSEEIGKNL